MKISVPLLFCGADFSRGDFALAQEVQQKMHSQSNPQFHKSVGR
jgi:hypothetical protein